MLRNDKNAGKLLDAVPSAQRSAGYLFAEAKYLRRGEKFSEAAAIILKAPQDKASLVDPDAWWIERRVLSRELIDAGDMKTAYRLVAAHSAESPSNAVDAEFHAGWYALRGLNDAQTAAKHFSRIAEIADGPISLSRAYYWLGRAAEAGGPGDAKAYYRTRRRLWHRVLRPARGCEDRPRRHHRRLSGSDVGRPTAIFASARPCRRSAVWKMPGTPGAPTLFTAISQSS